jgi:hypothetical protein
VLAIMTSDTAAIAELSSIRLGVWLLVLLTFVIAVAASVHAWLALSRHWKEAAARVLEAEATALLADKKWDSVLQLCEGELRARRNHVYAHWYMALAHIGAGRKEDARQQLERVVELAPSWREGTVAPYLKLLGSTHDG